MLLVLCWQEAGALAQAPAGQSNGVLNTIVVIDDPGVSCARDVPEEQRARARELLKEGNESFYDGLFAQALGKYRQAIKVWDCPPFHYNAAMAQLQLDQLVEAYDSLGTALERGEDGLDQIYQHAQKERERLLKRLAEIEVVSKDREAQVALDGKLLFVAPGSARVVVRPGSHQVVAARPGMISDTRQIVMNPGESKRFDLKTSLPPTLRVERRWAEWKPWAVLGGGAVLMVMGVYFQGTASASFDRFDGIIDERCDNPDRNIFGCRADQIPIEADDALNRGQAHQWAARVLYGAGGAVVIAATAMIYMNRERPMFNEKPANLLVEPLVTPEEAQIHVRFQF